MDALRSVSDNKNLVRHHYWRKSLLENMAFTRHFVNSLDIRIFWLYKLAYLFCYGVISHCFFIAANSACAEEKRGYITIGDKVSLIEGGTIMTVTGFKSFSGKIMCEWFDNNKLYGKHIPSKTLKRILSKPNDSEKN